ERKEKLAALDAGAKKLETEMIEAEKALKEAEKEEKDEERDKRIAKAKGGIDELNKAIAAKRKERDQLAKRPLPIETAYAVVEGKNEGIKKAGNACIQIKGDPERLGKEVPRRFPQVLGGQTLAAEVKTSGRLELAGWLTDPSNPLTARVMVNRIWQHHFSKG